ncbi:unnamed protein product, partial [Ilex paraguariensis]
GAPKGPVGLVWITMQGVMPRSTTPQQSKTHPHRIGSDKMDSSPSHWKWNQGWIKLESQKSGGNPGETRLPYCEMVSSPYIGTAARLEGSSP